MACVIVGGPRTWSGSRDRDGHREWKLKYLVKGLVDDGPAQALLTPGLPIPGDPYLIGNDADSWAFCKLDCTITPILKDEPNKHFELEFTFSTKSDEKRCKDQQIDDPLLIPDEISGSFVKYQEEATTDRFGRAVETSSHEQLRGPQVEFDRNRLQVKIKQNRADLQLPMLQAMLDTVNAFPLWGVDARCIKLSESPWEKKTYGQCFVYFTRTLTFDVRLETFDRNVLDEGTKCLKGHWEGGGKDPLRWVLEQIDGKDPDPGNPTHFIKFTDPKGNATKCVLNGAGLPAEVSVGPGTQYMSYNGSGNVGNDLSDDAWWIPITGDIKNVQQWDADEFYVEGEVVKLVFEYYIALDTVEPDSPDPSVNPRWALLGGTINDRGNYSSTTTYLDGDYVADAESAHAGMRHIEKYLGSDFTLLGIPLDLTS